MADRTRQTNSDLFCNDPIDCNEISLDLHYENGEQPVSWFLLLKCAPSQYGVDKALTFNQLLDLVFWSCVIAPAPHLNQFNLILFSLFCSADLMTDFFFKASSPAAMK